MNYTNPHGPSCPWFDITEAHGAANIKWCEETLCRWVSEPANTWSNLGYLIFAVAMIFLSNKNHANNNIKQFGPIIFFMGLGSLIYHQSNFYTTQILDFVGMFLFVGWAFGMNLIRLGKLQARNLAKFYVALTVFLVFVMHIMYVKGWHFQILIILFGFLIIGSEVLIKSEKSLKWFISAIVTLGIAFGFSFSDKSGIWCNPSHHGWFSQGHAVWHWISSIAMFFVYLHYTQTALYSSNRK